MSKISSNNTIVYPFINTWEGTYDDTELYNTFVFTGRSNVPMSLTIYQSNNKNDIICEITRNFILESNNYVLNFEPPILAKYFKCKLQANNNQNNLVFISKLNL